MLDTIYTVFFEIQTLVLQSIKARIKKIQTTNMYLFKTKKKNAFNIEGMPKRDH